MYGTLVTTVSEMKDERRLLFLKHMHLKKDLKNKKTCNVNGISD